MDEQTSEPIVDRRSKDRGSSDRRKAQRLVLHLAVAIKGETPAGEPIEETAEAVAASQNGALLKSKSDLSVGSQITVHNSENGENGNFKIVWTAPLPLEGMWNIGLELQDGKSPLWTPPAS
jgi:hypothetical protein